MADQFSGLSKLRPKGMGAEKPGMSAMRKPEKPMPESDVSKGEGVKTHTIEEHPDGHFESHMADGTHESHPDHLHMTTHVAHQVAPEAKHHHSAHDGFSHQSHGVSEDGQHDGTHDHQNIDELKGSMDKFLGEEQQEGAGEREPESENEPASMGGM